MLVQKVFKWMGYIKRKNIAKEIEEERRRLKSRLDKEHEKDMDKAIDRIETKYAAIQAGMEGEIEDMTKKIKDLQKKVINAEKAYHKYKKDVMEFKSLGTELGDEVQMIFESSAEMFKAIKRIENKIESGERKMFLKDAKVSKLLNQSNINYSEENI